LYNNREEAMKNTGKEEIAYRIMNDMNIGDDIEEDDKLLILDEIIYSLESRGFFTLTLNNSLNN
jgi:hypothetical protein